MTLPQIRIPAAGPGRPRQGFVDRATRDGIGHNRRHASSVPDDEGGAASTKVVRIVPSDIDPVNRAVWSKPGPF